MKNKIFILIGLILLFSVAFVMGSQYLLEKSKENAIREKEMTEEFAEHLLSVTTDEVRDAFMEECHAVREEKGYLPYEDTLESLIAHVNAELPELEFGKWHLPVVNVSENSILVKNEDESLHTYTVDWYFEQKEKILPGDEIYVLGTKDTVLCFLGKKATEIELNSVWIKDNKNAELSFLYDDREILLNHRDTGYVGYEDIADIIINNGEVTEISPYTDKRNARLLSIKNDSMELEGLGTFPCIKNQSDKVQVYKLFGEYEPYTVADLTIGYDFTDFVFNDKGEIVAALVTREDYLDRIRVVIKSSEFALAYHEEVVLCCENDMKWESGNQSGIIEGGEIITVDKEWDLFETDRIVFSPMALSSSIAILSVSRSQGTPHYRGTIEVERTKDGLLIINELPLDEYLYSVVPSEMPAFYPQEALKAQAVSARTYAYSHMQNSKLQSYGAHVDDSAAFQVYNNIEESKSATEAVRATEGKIIARNGNPVTTYFYSTSCGYGTDLNAWVTENDSYLCSSKISPHEEIGEIDFEEYIKHPDRECFEYEDTYFRWKYVTEINEEMLLENLKKRYEANPDQILTAAQTGYESCKVEKIGDITEIKAQKRAPGGAISELLIKGTEAEFKILSEKNVRYVLAGESTIIKLGINYGKDGAINGMLPSAFFVLEPTYEDGKMTEYTLWGGGFGHGIGMSQNGAKGMAKQGWDYETILKFFYKDTEISEMK